MSIPTIGKHTFPTFAKALFQYFGLSSNEPIGFDHNGRLKNVTVTTEDLGLENVDNTSDDEKPISTATQTALNGKQNTITAQPHIADPTGGLVQDGQSRAAIASIIDALEAAGIALPS